MWAGVGGFVPPAEGVVIRDKPHHYYGVAPVKLKDQSKPPEAKPPVFEVGDMIRLIKESDWTKKAGMSVGPDYIVQTVGAATLTVVGKTYKHNLNRFKLV